MVSFGGLVRKIFGSANERRVRGYRSRVEAINALEPEIQALSDEALRGKTQEFREKLANGASLEDLLVPAFAVVREAARRTIGLRPFDVQLIGGMVLHEGAIAEMKTGEGKTLVATLDWGLDIQAAISLPRHAGLLDLFHGLDVAGEVGGQSCIDGGIVDSDQVCDQVGFLERESHGCFGTPEWRRGWRGVMTEVETGKHT